MSALAWMADMARAAAVALVDLIANRTDPTDLGDTDV